jgi:hypothetical protein
MVIGESQHFARIHSAGSQQIKKLIRQRESAERQSGPIHFSIEHKPTTYLPDGSPEVGNGARESFWHDNGVRPLERTDRFTQTPDGKKLIIKIRWREHDNVEVAMKLSMLKAIVKYMHSRLRIALSHATGYDTSIRDEDRDFEFLLQQRWLVSVERRIRVVRKSQRALLRAAISSGKNVECDAAALKFVAERDDEGSLTSATNRNVSNANDRRRQSLDFEEATVIQRVSRSRDLFENVGERNHRELFILSAMASTVRSVAPLRC